jgi:UDP:flavonoid glycosyltransferase YjiC (YdhE family)
MVPFGAAAQRLGAEVRVAAPATLAEMVERAGFGFRAVEDPPEELLRPAWDHFRTLTGNVQNEAVVGGIFAGLNVDAALPAVGEECERWRPDLILNESAAFWGGIAAELHGIRAARVGYGLSAIEDNSIAWAAPPLDERRRRLGLPPDPDGERIRRSPYLTMSPASLNDPAGAPQPLTIRARDPLWDADAAPLPDWWNGARRPLVYLTLGSVAGRLPFEDLFGLVSGALGEVEANVLFTVGNDIDLALLDEVPPNVHVERWVPQADVLGNADAVVCHGGSGSTLGALAAGLPLVVMPLFADQPANAALVAAAGAGVAVQPPDPGALRAAVEHVLERPEPRARARAIAAELRAAPVPEEALEQVLAGAATT